MIFEHPGRAFSFLLQHNRDAFRSLRDVRNLVKVPGSFAVLDHHELGRQSITQNLLNHAFPSLIGLFLDDIGVVSEILQPGRDALQASSAGPALSLPRTSTESEFSRIESARL